MRIAFFCPHSDPLADLGEPDAGGQCLYEKQVMLALADAGHEVRAYTRLHSGKPAQETLCPGAEVWRYTMGDDRFMRKEDMGPWLAEFTDRVLKGQGEWLAQADVLHGHYWDGGVSALEASLAHGTPLCFTSHSLGALKAQRVPDPSEDGSTFRYPLRLAAEQRIIRAADRVIVLSEVERRAQIEHYAADPARLAIVPGGVDVEALAATADKPTLKQRLGVETDLLLFTVGRLDPRKGFVELIRALPKVFAEVDASGQSLTCMIPIGPQRPNAEEAAYLARMREAADELGIAQRIRWFHRLDDEAMRTAYGAADLFLCPSPYEPFGLVLVEAFAAGTPAVATCHGGPPEIIDSGIDGYLADPADSEALAEAINRVLLRPAAERAAMGEAALRKAHERFAWRAVAAQIANHYAEVAAASA